MATIITIHPENPQERLLKQAVSAIQDGAVIAYPTDSGYAIGCALDDKKAFERVCRIRDVDKKHNFTLVCPSLSEVAKYATVDNERFRMLKRYTPGPYTFILKACRDVPNRVINAKRKTVGVRIPDNKICLGLVECLGTPIMSTSLMLPGNDFAENDPYEIDDKIGGLIDLIVDGGYLSSVPTTVVDMSDDEISVTRVGAGDPYPFAD